MCARDQIIQTSFTSNMSVNRILFGNYIKHVHISLELITNGILLYDKSTKQQELMMAKRSSLIFSKAFHVKICQHEKVTACN